MTQYPIEPWMGQMFVDEHEALIKILDSQQLASSLPDHVRRISINPLSDCKVLDLCCGHGRVARAISAHAREVVGLDFSEPFIQKARALSGPFANLSWIQGDARMLSQLGLQGFDLIIRLYTSVGYFSYADECKILKECHAVADPLRGQLIYGSFNASWFRANRRFSRQRNCDGVSLTEEYCVEAEQGEDFCQCVWNSPAFQRPISVRLELYDEDRIRRLFRDAGWSIKSITPTLAPDHQKTEQPWERLVINAVVSQP